MQLATSNNERQGKTEIVKHKIENSDEVGFTKAESVINMEPAIHMQTVTHMQTIIQMEEVWFRYERELPDVVKGLSVSIHKGELFAIVGGNGTGKTTSMSIMCGLFKPYRGTVKVNGQPIDKLKGTALFENLMGVLPQNPQAFFVKKTVELDLYEMMSGRKISKEEQVKKVKYVSQLCELDNLLEMHPYDLSGGEQQRAALAKVLLLSPKILLLDEPTKGLDGHFKEKLADILAKLQRKGVTIVMVSHDIEFCASYATRCAMFFDGGITSIDEPRKFFCGKNFYTTAANRMARTVLPKAVLAEDVILALGGVVPQKNRALEDANNDDFDNNNHECGNNNCDMEGQNQRNETYVCKKGKQKLKIVKEHPDKRGIKLTPVRIGVSLLFLSTLVMTYLFFGGKYVDYRGYIVQFVMILELAICLGAIFPGNNIDLPDYSVQVSKEKRKLDKRTATALIIVLFAIPFTIYMGVYYLGDRKYYFISLLIIIESMLPFALIFENRKPQARELMVIAVLCAIAVAGRAAFFMLPQFKPVIAIVIIAGVCFGGETGFMVGALTAFVSNMMFSQGPLTPWQMFAYGIVGLIAGVCFQKGLLLKRRTSLCIFGAITTMSICEPISWEILRNGRRMQFR